MGLLHDLIQKIGDPALRERIQSEIDRALKQKKFGLVFEEHLPECVILYDTPIYVGSKVARKKGYVNDIYTVVQVDGEKALCRHTVSHECVHFQLNEIVGVAEFGEPIYPTLKPLDTVEKAPDSDIWHTLIEADNYHALQLLEYLYTGKVDCIYIDPPYNTGAKDWKYNNAYVDSDDVYRHSKWLSMMEKRLKLAKKLLNPNNSVLIVTIDEKEYLHLGCLLEEIFPEAYIQMITIVINPKGSTRGRFSRVEEYAFYCFMPHAYINGSTDAMLGEISETTIDSSPRWKGLLRSGMGSKREDSPNLFYPILIDKNNNKIIKACTPIPLGTEPNYNEKIDGYDVGWPIRNDGTPGRWMLSSETFNHLLDKGYISIGKYDKKRKTWGFSYLSKKYQQQIESGDLKIVGHSKNGQSVEVAFAKEQDRQVKTVWHRTRHDAGAYGSDLVSNVIGRTRAFSYPKSLYAVMDSLKLVTSNKPDALILDFFAGSGTTLHAVNLLNAADGGKRRCIMVTNNEVSANDASSLADQGHQPGDEEWEKLGIARYVTWPRTVCSIKGHDINGNPLKGNYLGSETPMADGFKSNVIFFKLCFLDKTSVALGWQFRALLPLLWMKSGPIGKCPELPSGDLPPMLILPENKFAVLLDEICYQDFDREIASHPEIQTIFIVTDSETDYRRIIRYYEDKICFQLYRDYLDNFRINTGGKR